MGTRYRNCDLHRSTTVVIEYMSSDLGSEHTRAGLVAQIAARTIKTGPPGVVNCDLPLGTSDSGTFDRTRPTGAQQWTAEPRAAVSSLGRQISWALACCTRPCA